MHRYTSVACYHDHSRHCLSGMHPSMLRIVHGNLRAPSWRRGESPCSRRCPGTRGT